MINTFQYIDVLETEKVKYIYTTIEAAKDYETAIHQLAHELGISEYGVSVIYKKAAILLLKTAELEENKKFQEYVKRCYDEDGCLSLTRIAREHKLETVLLKQIFEEYIRSLTEEERLMAYRFKLSPEATKINNIQILRTMVKGMTENPKVTVDCICKKQQQDFLKSISNICIEYKKVKKLGVRSNYLLK